MVGGCAPVAVCEQQRPRRVQLPRRGGRRPAGVRAQAERRRPRAAVDPASLAAAVGVITETNAEKAIEELKAYEADVATALRDGRWTVLPASGAAPWGTLRRRTARQLAGRQAAAELGLRAGRLRAGPLACLLASRRLPACLPASHPALQASPPCRRPGAGRHGGGGGGRQGARRHARHAAAVQHPAHRPGGLRAGPAPSGCRLGARAAL